MQKLVKVDNYDYNEYNKTIGETINKVNKLLEEGWKVIQMCSFTEPVGTAGGSYSSIRGNYGVLLLLEKE